MTASPLYSPDGRWLLVPTSTGIMIYDTATYQNGRLLAPDAVNNQKMAISPDGKALAIGEKRIAIENGDELPALDIPAGIEYENNVRNSYVSQTKFSPDGQMLALVYMNHQIGVWRLADGKLLYTLQGENIDFSTNSRMLVTYPDLSSEDLHISLYDAQTGSLLREWQGGWAMFLPDDRLAVETNGALRVFDISSGKVLRAFNGTHADFSPDGEYAALLFSNRVWIYKVSDGELVSTPIGDLAGIDRLTLSFSPDGQTLAGYAVWTDCCGGADNQLFLWRVADGALIRKENRWTFAYAPDGRSLVAGAEIWDTSDGSTRTTLDGFTGSIPGLTFSPDGEQLVAHSGEHLLSFQINREQLERIQPSGLDFPADRLVGIPDRELEWPGPDFWRLATGNSLDALTLNMIKSFPFDSAGASFSPDGNWVATSDRDRLQLWKNGEQTPVMEQKVCENATVSSLAFSPDSQQLAVTCANDWYEFYEDQIVQVWQVAPQGRRLMELTAEYPGHGYNLVAYSPDGSALAAAGSSVDLWSVSEGKLLFTIEAPFEAFSDPTVVSMAFSPDGQILAFARRIGGSVELWSTSSGQLLLELPRINHQNVLGLAFSADGKLLAASLDDGSVRLFGVR
jgi:WD40 repeat protein